MRKYHQIDVYIYQCGFTPGLQNKKANFPLLKKKISNFDWSCLNEGTLDEACNDFTDEFLKMVKVVFTLKICNCQA